MTKIVLFKSGSEDYQKAFSDRGYEVTFVEPLQFVFINLGDLNTKLNEDYDCLVLTSIRAIEAVSKNWDPAKFVLWSKKKVYTVGDATCMKIRELLGLEAIGKTAGNGGNLAKIILTENEKGTKFLFPCSNLKSEVLPEALKSEGMHLDAVTVYETNENDNLRSELERINKVSPCGLVFFSPSGCEYIHRQLQTFANRLATLPHFAIGNSTAHKIQNLGLEISGVAAKPNPESIVDAVLTYFNTTAACIT